MEQQGIVLPVPAEPSDHRKLMLRIAKLLSREDVDDILYLSEDLTAGSVCSGVDLMRSLEREGRLGPGNYTYLLSCLREIGRIDLERSLKKSLVMREDRDCTLPLLPSSFNAPNQLLTVKIGSLQHKRGQLISSMCHIANLKSSDHGSNSLWIPLVEQKYTNLFSSLTSAQVLPESSSVTKVVVTTLDSISKGLLTCKKAFIDFAQHQDYSRLSEDMCKPEAYMENFISALNSIGWRNDWRTHEAVQLSQIHPLHRAALIASSTVQELASEVVGERALDYNKVLKNMQSILFYCIREFVILHWLTTLMEFAAYCDTSLQSCKNSLRSMIEHHNPRITANWTFLHWLLHDTTLLEKINSEGLVNVADAKDSVPDSVVALEKAVLPVVLPLTLFALLYSKDFTPQDWLLVRARMANHFKSFRGTMVLSLTRLCILSAHSFYSFFNYFLQQSIDLIGTEFGPVVRELAVEVFRY